jgi:hypothetical protein
LTQIVIEVADGQKAGLLAELLSSLDFVDTLEVSDSNGQTQRAKQSYVKPYIGPTYAQMRVEERAFDAMKERLVMDYLGEFVAVFQQKVVDHDSDELTLLARINERFPEEVVLIRQVLEQDEPPFMFRSPHLVREDK